MVIFKAKNNAFKVYSIPSTEQIIYFYVFPYMTTI
jgi:hypothetical protein